MNYSKLVAVLNSIDKKHCLDDENNEFNFNSL